MVEEALNEICDHAKPGSILITNKRARCCNYESLKELEEYQVINIEDLQKYDTPGKNELLGNLGLCFYSYTFLNYNKYLLNLKKNSHLTLF